jgi:nitrite reductase (NO-forming)
MTFSSSRFAITRTMKSALVAVGFVVASGSVWQPQLLDGLAICLASLSAPAAQSAAAETMSPPAPGKEGATASDMHAPLVFTLRTGVAEGRMVYLGVGGDINGVVNPKLVTHEGETVQINLVNGEGAEHDIVIDQYGVRSNRVVGKGASSAVTFTASKTGEFAYFCSAPGHREAGMEGRVQVVPGPRAASPATAADVSRDPADVPAPIGPRAPQIVRVDLETVEVQGQLADKTTYGYWTFNGKVPGPMLRVRVGDTVEVHLRNDANSVMTHSVDFHAAIGPGGGAEFTQTDPGKEKVVTFKALTPGLFVYHCATPSVPQHITNGMYGMILVEPEGGLPQVDREFYIMQGEVYTAQSFGTQGDQEMDYDKLISERPEYFLFNGAVGALTRNHPLRASVGETVRIFFGVGGPNFTSSFHLIGGVFDQAYSGASLVSPRHCHI